MRTYRITAKLVVTNYFLSNTERLNPLYYNIILQHVVLSCANIHILVYKLLLILST